MEGYSFWISFKISPLFIRIPCSPSLGLRIHTSITSKSTRLYNLHFNVIFNVRGEKVGFWCSVGGVFLNTPPRSSPSKQRPSERFRWDGGVFPDFIMHFKIFDLYNVFCIMFLIPVQHFFSLFFLLFTNNSYICSGNVQDLWGLAVIQVSYDKRE